MGKIMRKRLYSAMPILVVLAILLVQANLHRVENVISARDERTALKLGQINGEDQEGLLQKRVDGMTWNEIASRYAVPETSPNRILSAETEQALLKKGYTKERIQEVVWQMDRLWSALSEIIMKPSVETYVKEQENELESYQKLYESINYDEGIPLVLEIAQVLEGIEQALDEYLISLQLDLDLKLYLEDKEQYEQKKMEKKILYQKDLLTLSTIFSKQRDQMQTNTEKNGQPPFQTSTTQPPKSKDSKVDQMKPKDPLEDLQKEIETIRKRSFGMATQ